VHPSGTSAAFNGLIPASDAGRFANQYVPAFACHLKSGA
jgi:hypothetical protein